jgi:hypothetical protein
MIQRIQSVYLLGTFIISGIFVFLFDLWKSIENSVFAHDLLKSESYQLKAIPILFLVSAILAFTAIFMFNNRKLQFVVGRLTILVNLILLGLLIYVSLTLPGETVVSEKGIGMFIPIFAILLTVLANKAIKKDEDLVKSADRLR